VGRLFVEAEIGEVLLQVFGRCGLHLSFEAVAMAGMVAASPCHHVSQDKDEEGLDGCADFCELAQAGTMQLNQARLLDLFAQVRCRSPLTDRWRICSRLTPRTAQTSAAQSLSSQLPRSG
jgi:hypothetical protein